MIASSQIVNRYGEIWAVRHDESTLLTTMGGYLIMAHGFGLITISTHLSPDEQAHGRNELIRQLTETPLDTIRTVYWPLDKSSSSNLCI